MNKSIRLKFVANNYFLRFALVIMVVFSSQIVQAKVLFEEQFNDLKNWKPLYFPKIKVHTTYNIESDGERKYLQAHSISSASALVYKDSFNVYEYPVVRWQWLVKNVYQKGDITLKKGDDYPARIYVFFEYDPEKASLLDKIKYNSYKLIYGKHPPHSSLNYIWANKVYNRQIVPSPYTEKAQLIILQAGELNLNKWLPQKVNILKDYKNAFGEAPPEIARIAVMNDSDNTLEESISYVDNIRVASE